jgi:hypothetical protein
MTNTDSAGHLRADASSLPEPERSRPAGQIVTAAAVGRGSPGVSPACDAVRPRRASLGGRGASLIDVVVRGADQPLRGSADDLLAELSDPDGRSVVLLARIWEDKITKDHPELRAHLEHVLATVTTPDHAEPDPHARRRRYYRRRVGPSRWLLAGVSFEQQPGRIITAVATRKDPKRWKP